MEVITFPVSKHWDNPQKLHKFDQDEKDILSRKCLEHDTESKMLKQRKVSLGMMPSYKGFSEIESVKSPARGHKAEKACPKKLRTQPKCGKTNSDNITPASWRAGQESVKRELGPRKIPKCNTRAKSDEYLVVANLPDQARQVLSDLQLDYTPQETFTNKSTMKRKAPKTEPEKQQPIAKIQHYVQEDIKKYIAKQKAERLRKKQQEMKMLNQKTKERQQVLQDLIDRQKSSFGLAKKFKSKNNCRLNKTFSKAVSPDIPQEKIDSLLNNNNTLDNKNEYLKPLALDDTSTKKSELAKISVSETHRTNAVSLTSALPERSSQTSAPTLVTKSHVAAPHLSGSEDLQRTEHIRTVPLVKSRFNQFPNSSKVDRIRAIKATAATLQNRLQTEVHRLAEERPFLLHIQEMNSLENKARNVEEEKSQKAAVKIQAAYRGHVVRQNLKWQVPSIDSSSMKQTQQVTSLRNCNTFRNHKQLFNNFNITKCRKRQHFLHFWENMEPDQFSIMNIFARHNKCGVSIEKDYPSAITNVCQSLRSPDDKAYHIPLEENVSPDSQPRTNETTLEDSSPERLSMPVTNGTFFEQNEADDQVSCGSETSESPSSNRYSLSNIASRRSHHRDYKKKKRMDFKKSVVPSVQQADIVDSAESDISSHVDEDLSQIISSKSSRSYFESPEVLQYSPSSLALQLRTELYKLESMEESMKCLTGIEKIRDVSLAQQETVSLAQLLKTRQQSHEREMRELQQKAQRETYEASQQLAETRHRATEAASIAVQTLDQVHKNAKLSLQDLSDRALEKHCKGTLEDARTPPSGQLYGNLSGSRKRILYYKEQSHSKNSPRHIPESALMKRERSPSLSSTYSTDESASKVHKPKLKLSRWSSKQSKEADSRSSSIKTLSNANAKDDSRSESKAEEISRENSVSFDDLVTEDEIDEPSSPSMVHSESSHQNVKRLYQSNTSVTSNDLSDFSQTDHIKEQNSFFDKSPLLTKFNTNMVNQSKKEEKLRVQHETALLRLREKALKEKAKAEMAWLEHMKRRLHDKGADDVYPQIAKKQQVVFEQLKVEQVEIKRLRELKEATSQENQEQICYRNKRQSDGSTDVSKKGYESDSEIYMESKLNTPLTKKEKNKLQNVFLDERYLTVREQKLNQRQKTVEELLAWKKHLDNKEKELMKLEKEALKRTNWEICQAGKEGPMVIKLEKDQSKDCKPTLWKEKKTADDTKVVDYTKDESDKQLLQHKKKNSFSHSKSTVTEDPILRKLEYRNQGGSGSENSIQEDIQFHSNSMRETSVILNKDKQSSNSNDLVDDTFVNMSINDGYNSDTFETTDSSVTSKKIFVLKKLQSPRAGPLLRNGSLSLKQSKHKGSESESEDSISHTETLSDASDIEGRIRALQEDLKKKKTEAERLKKERKNRKKERLQVQEQSLIKQIEAYDNFISQIKSDLKKELVCEPVKTGMKPQIKQPKVSGSCHAKSHQQGSSSRENGKNKDSKGFLSSTSSQGSLRSISEYEASGSPSQTVQNVADKKLAKDSEEQSETSISEQIGGYLESTINELLPLQSTALQVETVAVTTGVQLALSEPKFHLASITKTLSDSPIEALPCQESLVTAEHLIKETDFTSSFVEQNDDLSTSDLQAHVTEDLKLNYVSQTKDEAVITHQSDNASIKMQLPPSNSFSNQNEVTPKELYKDSFSYSEDFTNSTGSVSKLVGTLDHIINEDEVSEHYDNHSAEKIKNKEILCGNFEDSEDLVISSQNTKNDIREEILDVLLVNLDDCHQSPQKELERIENVKPDTLFTFSQMMPVSDIVQPVSTVTTSVVDKDIFVDSMANNITEQMLENSLDAMLRAAVKLAILSPKSQVGSPATSKTGMLSMCQEPQVVTEDQPLYSLTKTRLNNQDTAIPDVSVKDASQTENLAKLDCITENLMTDAISVMINIYKKQKSKGDTLNNLDYFGRQISTDKTVSTTGNARWIENIPRPLSPIPGGIPSKGLIETETLSAPESISRFCEQVPAKPPPPYPGSRETNHSHKTDVEAHTTVDSAHFEIEKIVSSAVDMYWTTYLLQEQDSSKGLPDLQSTQIISEDDEEKQSLHVYKKMLFDLCVEIIQEIYKTTEESEVSVWKKAKPKHKKYCKNSKTPENADVLRKVVHQSLTKILGLDGTGKEGRDLSRWNQHKNKDHVDIILVQELREEEPQWINYDEDELEVKSQLTDAVMGSLLNDAVETFSHIFQHKPRWL